MIVTKFGGTSVGSAEAIARTISIIRTKLPQKPVVVVSAMTKMTNLLYRIADTAASGDADALQELLDQLRNHHVTTAETLLEGHVEYMLNTISRINEICDALEVFTKAVCVLKEVSPRSKAIIIGNGEILSSTIIYYTMNAYGIKTGFIEARQMIITDENHLKAEPDKAAICQLAPKVINTAFEQNDAVITQGFVASSRSGEPTVLGRGSSDYTASLIGMAIEASAIEIWTDVNGVLTADPRVVPDALRLHKISYEEAAEMAHFGAKVLHPMTIEPAIRKNIPIYVLNSMQPENEGTVIRSNELIEPGVKSVSSKSDITVVDIFSPKMVNVSGFLGMVFEIFRRHNVSVDLISTSEASISVTVEAGQNLNGVVEELKGFSEVHVRMDKAQVSVVGKELNSVPGIFGKIFSALKDRNIYMASQGASNINISLVVDKDVIDDVVRDIHHSIFA